MSILPLAVAGGIGYLIGKRPGPYSRYRSNIPSTIDNIICQKLNYIFLRKEMEHYSLNDPWRGGYNHTMIRPEYNTFREDDENDDESETNR